MRLSYVVPTKNCVEWLAHAVKSVRAQNYPENDLECIIVNDGSTDTTEDFLSWLLKEDTRFKAINLSASIGRSKARNLGNEKASGDAILVLDADDIAYPNRSKLTAKALKNSEYVYGGAETMTAMGERLAYIPADAVNKERALETLENRIIHSSVAYTKDFALRYQYREGELSDLGLDDWAQQIEAITSGVKMDFIPGQPICGYRILASAITSTRDPIKVKEAKLRFLESLKVA